jgi:homopolymeric O-antigen transport system permease protein
VSLERPSAGSTVGAVSGTAVTGELPMREAVPVKRRLRPRDLVTSMRVARVIGARDIKIKYKQSALGPLWLLLQPLGILAAITVAFSGVTDIDTGGIAYIAFGLVGVTVWMFIAMTIAIAPQTFLANAALVRRSPAPRPAFITATVYSNLPLLGIMTAVTLIATVALEGIEPQVLLLPVFALWLLLFTWAVVVVIAPVAARFRDAVAMVPLIIQGGIFLSPVGYPLDAAPANLRTLLSINPVSGLIESWRWCVLGMSPELWVIGVGLAWTVVLLAVGWYMFGRMEVRLADFV